MKKIALILTGLAALGAVADGQKHPAHAEDPYVGPSSPAVKEHLDWFQDQKFGLMMHFGLYSVAGSVESWPLVSEDARWARADVEWTKDDDEYKRQYYGLNRCFNPIAFDAKDWARTAKRCGFRYVAFTTKHHDGFCLFDSKYTDYKTTDPSCPYSTNPNADIVRRVFDAFRAEGLGISAYFSKPDFHHEDFWENRGIGRFTTRFATYDPKDKPEKWARFRQYTMNQIDELVRNYGPIDALWLDGSWGSYDYGIPEAIEAARKIQPNLISVDRGANNAYMDIRTPEQCVPENPLPYPWESCITMTDDWGYRFDDVYKPARAIIHMLADVVAKGGNLALNVGPMPDGRLPRPALERLEEIGAWLRANGPAIYATRAAKPYAMGSWRFTCGKDGTQYAIRLWGEGLGRVRRTGLEIGKDQGRVKRVRHLATGRDIAVTYLCTTWQQRYALEFPDDLVRNDYADAFVLEFE